MKSKFQTIFLPSFGVIFLIVSLYIAFANPFPSLFQSGVYWVTLSLAAAACAALIPGFIEFKYNGFLRAGGALAVFCLMYFFVPAMAKNSQKTLTDKLTLFVASVDSTHLQKLDVDFDKNSSADICDYCAKSLSDYYGTRTAPGDFTFYRRSDGKIYNNEKCNQLSEYELLIVSNKIVGQFADKRQAYTRLNKVAE